jgi:hypothetical protein
MTNRSCVAILYTQPETVLDDYRRLFDLAGGADALHLDTTTICLRSRRTCTRPRLGR